MIVFPPARFAQNPKIFSRYLPALLLLLLTTTVQADVQTDEPTADGRLIRVQLPLTGNADQHIQNAIRRAVDILSTDGRRRPVLILELSPARRSANFGLGSDIERVQSLARFLSTDPALSAVKTVAYIPQSIQGHGVLLAMACEEIAAHPAAEFGAAGADEDPSRPVEPVIVSLYQQIAQARRTIPEPIALGMLDARLEVHKVETEDATEFVLADAVNRLQQTKTVISDEVLTPAGSLALFTGSEGRTFGFVKYLAENHAALARVLQISAEAVVEDQSLVGDWRPVMLDIQGPITLRLVGQIKTLIATEKDQRDVNWIGIRIDSAGGELDDCLGLAAVLAGQHPAEVRTVAYVPLEAAGGAELIALACDQLVMHPAAKLGGAVAAGGDAIEGEAEGDQDEDQKTGLSDAAITVIKTLAEDTDHSWSLLAALLDPGIEVFRYSNTTTGEVRTMSVAEAASLSGANPDGANPEDANQWQKGAMVSTPGQAMVVDSARATELALAFQVVDNFDQFKQLYGFADDPRVAEPNWALELVEALASPGLAAMLLVVGFLGIYLELHSPGFGIGGFTAAVAFMLFFWSKFLHGTATWLEVMLFVGGLFFLLMEAFVLPGFGIFGLGGAVMVILSLLLASQTFLLPHSDADMIELRDSMVMLLAAVVCVLVATIVLRRWLPHAPIFRNLLLRPPEHDEQTEIEHRESVADYSELLGQQGTATTDLMPAGKANVAGILLDVIADGDIVDAGQTVEVVSVRGTRVLVKSVKA